MKRINWQLWLGFLLSILLSQLPAGLRQLGQLLSDPNLQPINKYDLIHKGKGENARDIVRPAESLIDSAGIVGWRMLTENYWVRARPEQILEAANALR